MVSTLGFPEKEPLEAPNGLFYRDFWRPCHFQFGTIFWPEPWKPPKGTPGGAKWSPPSDFLKRAPGGSKRTV